MAEFESLLGKTLTRVEQICDDAINFECSDGSKYQQSHHQICCECVYVESITGDLTDLLGTPILQAEVVTSNDTPEDFKHHHEPESQTWTFYKLATIKGGVTIRWFGRSNGYYSESVSFDETAKPMEPTP